MFKASLDNKSITTDPNGNEIVDLTSSTFRNNEKISQYFLRKVPSDYRMRPDLIALAELGTTDKTEYIMMFNQIGNPFSIDKDDILMIPELIEADSMVWNGNESPLMDEDDTVRDILIKNYYKHSNREENLVDMTSYDDFLNTPIPSGKASEIPSSGTETGQAVSRAPYMLRGNEEAVTIKNGRIYFNTPGMSGTGEPETEGGVSGIAQTPFDEIAAGGKPSEAPTRDYMPVIPEDIVPDQVDGIITKIIHDKETPFSDANCTYNGTSLSDFIKAINDTQR